jgi:hypothetical protein
MVLDDRLIALAGCPVLETNGNKREGWIIFNPYPIIRASDDNVLSHEICHRISGKQNYDLFNTAGLVRGSLFSLLLNLLMDWKDEKENGDTYPVIRTRLNNLHNSVKTQNIQSQLQPFVDLYKGVIKTLPNLPNNPSAMDLICYIDNLLEIKINELDDNQIEAKGEGIDFVEVGTTIVLDNEEEIKVIGKEKKDKDTLLLIIKTKTKGKEDIFPSSGYIIDSKETSQQIQNFLSELGGPHGWGDLLRSNYYEKQVSKYQHMISELSKIWTRNKYQWVSAYEGEINRKDLVGLYKGSELELPVFQQLRKNIIDRSCFFVIDTSGSTANIKTEIMDSAIIVVESLRQCGVSVSVLDVGTVDKTINGINEPIKENYFTPQSHGGTPLGDVIGQIKEANSDSYLIIVTDGCPDSWETLQSSLKQFPGEHLTLVIGPSFTEYYSKVNGQAISVKPHTIIQEIVNANALC